MSLPKIGVEAVVDNLSGYQSAMKTIQNSNASASSSVQATAQHFDALGTATHHLGNIIDFAFGGLITSAISSATGAIGNFIGGIMDAGKQGILVENQLNAVLKSTKGIAGVTAKSVNDYADKMSNLTKFSDDSIVSAQNLLLTFTKIGKDVFPDVTTATLDMATAMHMDLQSAALVVGKAMNDPIAGVTSLQREGVKLTDSQKKMVAQFVKTGNIAKAQAVILAELQTEFGGSAAAATTPWDILQNKLEKFQQSVGEAIIPAIDSLVSAFMPLVSAALPAITDFISNKIAPAFNQVANVAQTFFDFIGAGLNPLQALGQSLAQIFSGTTLGAIGTFISDLGDGNDVLSELTKLLPALGVSPETTKGITDLGGVIAELGPAGTIAAAGIGLLIANFTVGAAAGVLAFLGPIVLLGGAIAILITAITHFSDLEAIFGPGGPFSKIGDVVRQAAQDILTPFVKAFNDIQKAADKLPAALELVANQIAAKFKPATDVIDNIAEKIFEIQNPGKTATSTPTKGHEGLNQMGQMGPAAPKTTSLGIPAGTVLGTTGVKSDVPVNVKPHILPPDTGEVATTATAVNTALNAALTPVNITKPVASGGQAAINYVNTVLNPQVKTTVGTAVDGGKTTASVQSPAIGAAMTTGIAAGITANQGAVITALNAVVKNAVASAMTQIQAHSPSKVFAKIGGHMMTGLALGIDDNKKSPVMATINAMTSTVAGAMSPSAMPITTGAGGDTTNNTNSTQYNTTYNLGVQPYQPSDNGLGALVGALR